MPKLWGFNEAAAQNRGKPGGDDVIRVYYEGLQ